MQTRGWQAASAYGSGGLNSEEFGAKDSVDDNSL
jgi:hypothetical protein